MRNLVIATILIAAGTAHADVGLGLFIGEPTAIDLKVDAGYRSSVDLAFGWNTFRDNRDHYLHLTYLATLVVGHGDAVLVPLRLGIGGAIYDDGSFDAGLNFAVRAPLELAFRFRNAPIELYGELALLLTFIDANNNNDTIDLQGGVGFRAYF
jgi:hypothetical protein